VVRPSWLHDGLVADEKSYPLTRIPIICCIAAFFAYFVNIEIANSEIAFGFAATGEPSVGLVRMAGSTQRGVTMRCVGSSDLPRQSCFSS
jgi:hypothetical protein